MGLGNLFHQLFSRVPLPGAWGGISLWAVGSVWDLSVTTLNNDPPIWDGLEAPYTFLPVAGWAAGRDSFCLASLLLSEITPLQARWFGGSSGLCFVVTISVGGLPGTLVAVAQHELQARLSSPLHILLYSTSVAEWSSDKAIELHMFHEVIAAPLPSASLSDLRQWKICRFCIGLAVSIIRLQRKHSLEVGCVRCSW